MAGTLESGACISHYRVIGPLGAGGMGEVYRAQDTTLERTVALKILPPELVRNDERVRRFVQEAKAASSLSHPNIITIHEIGQAEVSSSGTVSTDAIHYIAMELVDGSTLKRKIHEGSTDLRTVLGYLAQCAEGLAKAHGAGLVHRDLKPENIMVTRDGFAKVLDFGLAKLTISKSPEGRSADATAVRDNTREGQLLGTVAYMSPEQVEGKIVDHRSDIFSFGAILYEAATHRRPFEADSDFDVMHSILHATPASIEDLAPGVPAELRRVIRRCLAKDPERRYQSMKDLALELNDIVAEYDELSASAASRTSGSISQPIQIGRRRRRAIWVGGIAVAAVVIGAIALALWRARTAVTAAPVKYNSMRMERVTTSGRVFDCAISPDGKYIAHVLDEAGRWTLFVRQVATGTDMQVIAPQAGQMRHLSFSRDGSYVFFASDDAESATGMSLYRMAVLGGPVRKVLRGGDGKVSFSPNGEQFAFARERAQKGENALVVAKTDGTGERELLVFDYADVMDIAPSSWSPDGKRIATVRRQARPDLQNVIVEIDATTAALRPIGKPDWEYVESLDWLPDGKGLVLAAMGKNETRLQLWLQPYPDGQPARLTNDLNGYRHVVVSADGKTLSALRWERDFDLYAAALDDPSGGTALSSGAGNREVVSLSASSTGAVVYSFDNDQGMDIGVIDSPGSPPRVLTSDGSSVRPSISADGKTIAYTSVRQRPAHVWIMNADGTGAKQLTNGHGEGGSKISPDGKAVFFTARDRESVPSVWRIPVSGGAAVKIAGPIASEYCVAPDGRRIAYVGTVNEQGRELPYLMIVNTDGQRVASIPWPWSTEPLWTPDGKAVAYVEMAGGVSNVFAQPLDGSPRRQLTHFTSGAIGAFQWLPNGRMAMTRISTRSDAVLIRSFH